MKKICADIDLLGFSNHIKDDFYDAILLIENYNDIFQDGFTISKKFKTFDTFLPGSDSIFILADPDKADDFIQDISYFLIDCFMITAPAYLSPIDKNKPTKVVTQEISCSEKKDEEIKSIDRNWYPTIFKGGVVCDEVETFSQQALYNGKFEDRRNLAGKAVISAVALEKSGRGPRLFCNDSIISILSKNIYIKYIIGKNNVSEILWPINIFLEENEPYEETCDKYDKLMKPAINLWKEFKDPSIGEIYFNFMKLITISAIRYSELHKVDAPFKQFLKDYLQENNIFHFYDSLIDYTSGM